MSLLTDEALHRFLQLYARTFPTKEQVHLADCTSLSSSWEIDIFALRLEYAESKKRKAEDIILKIYYGNAAAQKAQKEFRALQQLIHSVFPVPQAFLLTLADSPFGQPCVVMSRIHGHTLTQALQKTSSAQQQNLLRDFSQLYVQMHTLDWRPFALEPARYHTRRFIQTWLLESYMFMEQLQPHTFSPAMDWLQERSKDIVCRHFAVVHGDFHPDHILLRHDGTAFVIDWAAMDVSDYRFDLAWTLLLLSTQHNAEQAKIVLTFYEQFSDQIVEHLDFFMVIACVRRLFGIMVSLSNKGIPSATKANGGVFMHAEVEHIQAVYTQLQDLTKLSLPQIEILIQSLTKHAV
jgi:Ser/Thr protein kinase RdoA (MazF antagonist)